MALTQVSTNGIKDGQVHTADLADAQITAGKLHADALDRTYTLGADGSNHYTFTGEGLTGAVNDPTLYLTRGKTYRFVNGNSSGAHPFRIQTTVNGSAGTEYNTGVTNNGGAGGSTIVFEVPHAAPDVLYYQCTSHGSMGGILYVTGALADGTVTTAKLADDAVTDAKLANSINAAIAANTAKTSLEDNSVTTAKIADEAVTLAKLPHGTGSTDGKFLRANNGADPTFESLPSSGATLSGSTDNTVVTVTGSNAMQGEANLTFDGNQLSIAHTDPKIALVDTTNNTDAYIFSDDNGSLRFQADQNSEASDSRIRFQTDGTERVSIDSEVKVFNGNIFFATSGKGINFNSSNTGTSELLHDYEEGTFTPLVVNGWGILGGSGGGAGAAAVEEGKYVKVGDIVHLYFVFKDGGSSGASYNGNTLLFYGLPFQPETDSQWGNSGNKSQILNAFSDTNSSGGGEGLFCAIAQYGSTSLAMRRRTNGGTSAYTGTNLGSNGRVFVTGTYRAA